MLESCAGRFPALCFGQVGQVRWAFFVTSLILPHQYWFMNTIIFLVDQWFNACTGVNSGNFRISGRARLLIGPSHFFLFNQMKNY